MCFLMWTFVCSKKKTFVLFVSGEDVHAEESFFFSGFCRDQNPLPVPGPPGGSGPPKQMVRCQEFMFDIAEIY